MNKIAFGQYYNTNSILHRLDPRSKLIALILLMISIFVIKMENNGFIYLGILLIFVCILIFISNVPIKLFLKSLKQIMFLLLFSFVFQIIFNRGGDLLVPNYELNISIINILLVIGVIIIYNFTKKYISFKFIYLLITIICCILVLHYGSLGYSFKVLNLKIYKDGLLTGIFIIGRIFILILFSSILTLTTKPTDLNNGLESLLKPLEYIKIPTSILSMMLSLALRYIPTLFNETDKILKAQASRGVDFNEGKFKDKVIQIVSLLIPMFAISFNRAIDLADAMEARGYIPGAKRTKLVEMKFKINDYIYLFVACSLLIVMIVGRIYI